MWHAHVDFHAVAALPVQHLHAVGADLPAGGGHPHFNPFGVGPGERHAAVVDFDAQIRGAVDREILAPIPARGRTRMGHHQRATGGHQ